MPSRMGFQSPQFPVNPLSDALQGNAASMQQNNEMGVAQAAASKEPAGYSFTKTVKPNGEAVVTFKGPASVADELQSNNEKYKQLMAGYASTMEKQQQDLSARIAQSKKNPLVNILGTIASQYAQQPNMPGGAQALGRAAQILNPTTDQLQQRQMALAEQQVGLHSQMAKAGEEAARQKLAVEAGQRDEARVAIERTREEAQEKRWQKDAELKGVESKRKFQNDVMDITLKGAILGDQGEKAIFDRYVANGFSPEEAKVFAVSDRKASEEIHGYNEKIIEKRATGDFTRAKALQTQRDAAAERTQANQLVRPMVASINSYRKEEGQRFERVTKAIQDSIALQQVSDKMRDVLSKHKGSQGIGVMSNIFNSPVVIAGRQEFGMLSEEQARHITALRAEYFTALEATRVSIGALSTYWSPASQKALEAKLVNASDPKSMTMGKLDALSGFSKLLKERVVEARPDINWSAPSRLASLGAEGPELAAKYKKQIETAGGKFHERMGLDPVNYEMLMNFRQGLTDPKAINMVDSFLKAGRTPMDQFSPEAYQDPQAPESASQPAASPQFAQPPDAQKVVTELQGAPAGTRAKMDDGSKWTLGPDKKSLVRVQ